MFSFPAWSVIGLHARDQVQMEQVVPNSLEHFKNTALRYFVLPKLLAVVEVDLNI